MNTKLLNCHISPATSAFEDDYFSFRISFRVLDVRSNLAQEEFHGNRLLMHEDILYRVSQPTRTLHTRSKSQNSQLHPEVSLKNCFI